MDMNWLLRALLVCAALGAGSMMNARAVTRSCPYSEIALRNVFHLQAIPPRVDLAQPIVRPKVIPQVTITGTTDVCGRRQVLVEISEPGTPMLKSVVTEGERAGPLEVVQIDVKKSQVRVNIHGEEQLLTLRAPQPSMLAPPAPPAAVHR